MTLKKDEFYCLKCKKICKGKKIKTVKTKTGRYRLTAMCKTKKCDCKLSKFISKPIRKSRKKSKSKRRRKKSAKKGRSTKNDCEKNCPGDCKPDIVTQSTGRYSECHCCCPASNFSSSAERLLAERLCYENE